MKNWFCKSLLGIIAGGLFLFLSAGIKPSTFSETIVISPQGSQPSVAVGSNGSIHVVFGRKNEIFYSSSSDKGQTFNPARKIITLPDMHLGMTRGPQIAVTEKYVVVANVTRQGQIVVYRGDKTSNIWSQPVNLLDTHATAPEGFVALAAGPDNTVYATWLDVRINKQNNVYGAFSKDGGQTWSKNTLVYASPEGKVCECCRPSISADFKGNVYVMFRNNLAGNRDMYLAHSTNGGKNFNVARKLGLGTWPLQACPMEGGGLAITAPGKPITLWKRQKEIFVTSPGLVEQSLGEGRNCSVATSTAGNLYVWQHNNTIWAKTDDQPNPVQVGQGAYPRAVKSGKSNVVIWESKESIVARQVPEANLN